MKALITGASGGIGRDMARYLVSLGHSVIAVGRNEKKLEDLKKELGENSRSKSAKLRVFEKIDV